MLGIIVACWRVSVELSKPSALNTRLNAFSLRIGFKIPRYFRIKQPLSFSWVWIGAGGGALMFFALMFGCGFAAGRRCGTNTGEHHRLTLQSVQHFPIKFVLNCLSYLLAMINVPGWMFHTRTRSVILRHIHVYRNSLYIITQPEEV
jgi:hypothetical protein